MFLSNRFIFNDRSPARWDIDPLAIDPFDLNVTDGCLHHPIIVMSGLVLTERVGNHVQQLLLQRQLCLQLLTHLLAHLASGFRFGHGSFSSSRLSLSASLDATFAAVARLAHAAA